MNPNEIERFIELLEKWKNDDLTWGECCELKEMKSIFADAIQETWTNWS